MKFCPILQKECIKDACMFWGVVTYKYPDNYSPMQAATFDENGRYIPTPMEAINGCTLSNRPIPMGGLA